MSRTWPPPASVRHAVAPGVTKLYSTAKQSYRHALPLRPANDSPQIQSLHRKAQNQKDRLLAWGFEWQDGNQALAGEGSIDESVERAGLTEVVTSVLENITNALMSLEGIQSKMNAPVSAFSIDMPASDIKSAWDASDVAHYEDLLRDIDSSISLLCDLSRSRRTSIEDRNASSHISKTQSAPAKLKNVPEQVSLQDLEISRSSLMMPEEAPPPYLTADMPCTTREVGRFKTRNGYTDFKGNLHQESTIPVLVEYVKFDDIYQDSNVPLPMNRMQELSNILASKSASKPHCLTNLVGILRDSKRPRIGLISELPQFMQPSSMEETLPASSMRPSSLFNLLQSASKPQTTTTTLSHTLIPPLEDRFRLAQELVSGFEYLFAAEFTHRDVNSNSIIFFPSRSASGMQSTNNIGPQYAIRKPVLGSFDLFSEYDIDARPESTNQNIYRHPDDPQVKGPNSVGDHHARFEMYSLGLVLLEIGLWSPLTSIWKEKYSLRDFSIRLEKIWIRRLASKCGKAYMNAVQQCFYAGDDPYITHEALQETYKYILRKLERCCLMDDDEGSEDSHMQLRGDLQHHATFRADSIMSPSSKGLSNANLNDGRVESSEDIVETPTERISQDAPQDSVPPGAWPKRSLKPVFEISPASQTAHSQEKPPGMKRFSFPEKKLPQSVLEQWPALGRRLTKIVSRALRDSGESSSVGIEFTGETEDEARPTLCVMCTSTKRVSKAIKKNLAVNSEVYDLIVMRGQICRSKSAPLRSDTAIRSARRRSTDEQAKNKDHHARPICGASIGAWKDFEHLPPVSLGGIVLVDGEPYGMSVHHMLEEPADDEEDDEVSKSSGARLDNAKSDLDAMSNEAEDSDFSDEFLDSDDEGFGEGEDDDDEPNEEYGDTEGVTSGQGVEITITQPALADVPPDFFPVEEDKDEDHIASHTLGYIHASSGIRRSTHRGVDHEIDWALLKLDQKRLQPCNLIAGGRRFCPEPCSCSMPELVEPVCRKPYNQDEDLYPYLVAKSEDLGGLAVHCIGRTTGLGGGRVSNIMTFVKMPGRLSWSESWTVDGDLGLPGDSGAWLVDNQQGRICGHVLARSTASEKAYISPMDVMLEDIKAALGAKMVCLPGSQGEALATVDPDSQR